MFGVAWIVNPDLLFPPSAADVAPIPRGSSRTAPCRFLSSLNESSERIGENSAHAPCIGYRNKFLDFFASTIA